MLGSYIFSKNIIKQYSGVAWRLCYQPVNLSSAQRRRSGSPSFQINLRLRFSVTPFLQKKKKYKKREVYQVCIKFNSLKLIYTVWVKNNGKSRLCWLRKGIYTSKHFISIACIHGIKSKLNVIRATSSQIILWDFIFFVYKKKTKVTHCQICF